MSNNQYHFEGQKPYEEVKFVLHRHWATLVRPVLYLVLLWIGVGIVFYVFKASWVTAYVIFGILAFSVLYGGLKWFIWSNSLSIVTDLRVVDIDQRGLFHRTVASAMLENVEDVTVETKGVWASSFNFGTIMIQTGGSERMIEMEEMPDPYAVQQKILSIMEDTDTRAEDEPKEKKKVVMD